MLTDLSAPVGPTEAVALGFARAAFDVAGFEAAVLKAAVEELRTFHTARKRTTRAALLTRKIDRDQADPSEKQNNK